MMTDILAFFACAFNIIGMLTFMYDTKALIEIYQTTSRRYKIAVIVGFALISQIVVYTDIYLIIVLAVEFALILLWNRKHETGNIHAWIKGIISLLALLVTEMAVGMLFYYQGTEVLTEAQIQVVGYLGMATVQFLLIVFQETRGLDKSFRKMLIIALEVKALENLAWLVVCIEGLLFEKTYIPLTAWFIFTIFVCYMVFFIVLYKTGEREEIERRSDIHINTYEYYLHMEEEQLQIRKLYHDMKNQLMILQSNQQGNADVNEKQVQILAEKMAEVKKFYHTGFPSLDILLFDGKMKAESRGIQFEAVISADSLSFMKEEDVNVIFSNAIINAIEACDKITEGPKSITIKAGKNRMDTVIYVRNTVNKNREKGSLRTGKKNKKMHGIGMTSIREAAEKYNGYVSVIEENDTFQLAILFGGGKSEKTVDSLDHSADSADHMASGQRESGTDR